MTVSSRTSKLHRSGARAGWTASRTACGARAPGRVVVEGDRGRLRVGRDRLRPGVHDEAGERSRRVRTAPTSGSRFRPSRAAGRPTHRTGRASQGAPGRCGSCTKPSCDATSAPAASACISSPAKASSSGRTRAERWSHAAGAVGSPPTRSARPSSEAFTAVGGGEGPARQNGLRLPEKGPERGDVPGRDLLVAVGERLRHGRGNGGIEHHEPGRHLVRPGRRARRRRPGGWRAPGASHPDRRRRQHRAAPSCAGLRSMRRPAPRSRPRAWPSWRPPEPRARPGRPCRPRPPSRRRRRSTAGHPR